MTQPIIIKGRAAALVMKETGFDLTCPEATPAHAFTFVRADAVADGVLSPNWAAHGYRHVGFADLVVEVMPVKGMVASAVEALKAERQSVLATAQKEATRLDGEIQKLLAIGYEVGA